MYQVMAEEEPMPFGGAKALFVQLSPKMTQHREDKKPSFERPRQS